MEDEDGNGFEIVLPDGSESYDPVGDIQTYQWYQGGMLLGFGIVLEVNLSLGVHSITLRVTDLSGLIAEDWVDANIV